MQARRVILCLALVAVAGLPSACGGGKEAISKADFITQANALCTTLNAKMETAAATITDEADGAKFLVETMVPELGATTQAIRDLGFPEGDEKLLGGLMDETETILKDIAKDPAKAAAAEASPFDDINKQLVTYGLTVCGEG
jgi:hypothetical protein